MLAIEKTIRSIEEKGLKRECPVVVKSPQGARVRINNKSTLLLCSNDYLCLANHPLVKEAAIKAVEKWGAGAGASRLISGTMTAHVELEEKLKTFKKTDAALLFNSGCHANMGTIPALVGRGDEIFSDKLNHASIVDGCILSRANIKRYPHADIDRLEDLLKKSAAKNKLIITDGVFSMDGDVAPLKDIISLMDKYGATLLVDDAHSTGVLGKNGRGTLEHFNISHPSIIQMGTLGKALGSFGAYIAGSKKLVELLTTKARSFIYSTALPPSVCAAAKAAIEIMEKEPERRKRLMKNAERLRDGLKKAGFNTLTSSTPIIPVITKNAKTTMDASRKLLSRGVFVQGIRPPTVAKPRLRITVTSGHTEKDLDFALNAIKETLNECGI